MKTAEMFKSMQRKFEDSLARKKSQMAVTRPKSPNFSKPKSKPLQRDQFNETHPSIEKFKSTTPKAVRPASAKPVK